MDDSVIASNIVRKILTQMKMCLASDRSKVKLNMLEKGLVQGTLNDRTINGFVNYVQNMYPQDIKAIIDDIESEIKNRGR